MDEIPRWCRQGLQAEKAVSVLDHLRLTCVALSLLAIGYQPSVLGASEPADMALVPAGEFAMGTAADSEGLPDEQPLRLVYLSAFWIDRYEVTNAGYQQFVQATGYQAPANAHPASTLWNTMRQCPVLSSTPSSM